MSIFITDDLHDALMRGALCAGVAAYGRGFLVAVPVMSAALFGAASQPVERLVCWLGGKAYDIRSPLFFKRYNETFLVSITKRASYEQMYTLLVQAAALITTVTASVFLLAKYAPLVGINHPAVISLTNNFSVKAAAILGAISVLGPYVIQDIKKCAKEVF